MGQLPLNKSSTAIKRISAHEENMFFFPHLSHVFLFDLKYYIKIVLSMFGLDFNRLFVCQDENENEPESFPCSGSLLQTNWPSVLRYNEGSVRSSRTSSRTNQSFGFRLRFRFRLGT